jgi:ribosomal-protein-alanine N-acetyltransferase
MKQSNFSDTKLALRLRKLKYSDMDNYFSIVGDAETMAFITEKPYSRQESDHEVNRLIERYSKSELFGVWVAESLIDNNFIGLGALIQMDESVADIGYRVQKEKRGQGFGIEIAKLLIEKAKNQQLKKIVAEVETENKASVRILEKLGFTRLLDKINQLGNEIAFFELELSESY